MCCQTKSLDFPIGMFGVEWSPDKPDGGSMLEQLRSTGINVINCPWYKSSVDHKTNSDVLAFLNKADAAGLRVMLSLNPNENIAGGVVPVDANGPHFFTRAYTRLPGDTRKRPDYSDAESMMDFSDSSRAGGTIKNHPALYGYLLADEPFDTSSTRRYQYFVSASDLQAAYRELAADGLSRNPPVGDATHPYLVTLDDYEVQRAGWKWNTRISPMKLPEGLQNTNDYTGSADIIINDTYIIHDPDQWRAVLTSKFESLRESQVKSAKHLQYAIMTYDMYHTRWNDLSELRFEVYSAIVHGAEGIWFYAYDDMYFWDRKEASYKTDDRPRFFTLHVLPVVRELAQCGTLLNGQVVMCFMHGKPQNSECYASVNNQNIEYIARKKGGQTILVVVNMSNKPIEGAEINLNSLPANRNTADLKSAREVFSVVGDSLSVRLHPISIPQGILVDNLEPWQTHAYVFGSTP